MWVILLSGDVRLHHHDVLCQGMARVWPIEFLSWKWEGKCLCRQEGMSFVQEDYWAQVADNVGLWC